MTPNKEPKGKLLFLFPHPVRDQLKEVRKHKRPSEIMYGVIELENRGWQISVSDSRFRGLSGGFISRLKHFGINLIDFKTIKEISKANIIIVKDDFSLMMTLISKLFGKKIIYIDSMFELPTRARRRYPVWLSLKLADAIISYSQSQIELWAKSFHIPQKAFTLAPYTIDIDFYVPHKDILVRKPLVLAIGRDTGRDFYTLAKALDGLDIRLALVTLPYLSGSIKEDFPWVEFLENLSYEELFKLYSESSISVVPLKKNIFYPSGIRGVIEAMLLKKPVICTKTPILEESFTHNNDIVFVDPEDHEKLRDAIVKLVNSDSECQRLVSNALITVNDKFSMEKYVNPLDNILKKLY